MKKKALYLFLIIIIILTVFILSSYINHRIRLDQERDLREPLGQLVEVNGKRMSVYTEGAGPKTLVFLSGGGTCSPILDFRSLYSLLSGEYQIVVVEKFGYGFSDVVNEERDIDTILAETRAALEKSGLEAPYILCPHSMSGIEALYWAQQYPEEVEAIIGLDMAVPGYYEVMQISIPAMKIGQYGAALGITRFLPNIAESDAIRYGTLTDEEKERYRAVFYSRTATVTMINECRAIKGNAKTVAQNGVPQVPMLLFLSDGSDGTGFDTETWRRIPKEYLAGSVGGKYIELDCPHYVHDHEYERISDEIRRFISEE
ncbi:MAG: alpha/beta hydrolase [Eubacterium sp.]|nr:alpha/beta hydrolase [Eubacterium sp.]